MLILRSLDGIHTRLVSFGELPDYGKAADFTQRLAKRLVSAGEIAEFQNLCRQSGAIPTLDPQAWGLLHTISELAAKDGSLVPALSFGLEGNWPEALWHLRSSALDEPSWWGPVKDEICQLHLGTTSNSLTPYVALNRLVHTLQASEQETISSEDKQNA